MDENGPNEAEAKFTMLALIREKWKADVFTLGEMETKHPNWIAEIIHDFRKYYKPSDPNITDAKANAGLDYYIRKNVRGVWYGEKQKAIEKVKKSGGSFDDSDKIPDYLDKDVYLSFCKHWGSDEFKKKSNINVENKAKNPFKHTAGSKSFRVKKKEWKDKNGRDPTFIEALVDNYTKKRTGMVTTPEVESVKERLDEIIQQTPIDPSDQTAMLDLWMQVLPPKKNRIVGLPNENALDIQSKRKRSSRHGQASQSSQSQSDASSPVVSNELLMSAMMTTFQDFQREPSMFSMTHDQIVQYATTLATRLASGSQPLTQDVHQSLVSMLVLVVENVISNFSPLLGAPQSTGSGSRVAGGSGTHVDETHEHDDYLTSP